MAGENDYPETSGRIEIQSIKKPFHFSEGLFDIIWTGFWV